MSEDPEPDSPAYGLQDASFRAAGGVAGIERLVDDFYRLMDELPQAVVIRRMHPADLGVARDKLSRFLCGWLGGPRRYSEKFGPIHIPRAHEHLRIGTEARDAWLLCMQKAIALQPFSADFQAYLLRELEAPVQKVFQTSKKAL